MRLIIQKVVEASVTINGIIYSSIDEGLLCYVAFCDSDNKDDFEWVIQKILNLKIFINSKSLKDKNASILVVSQFTLFGSVKKGNKPSWSKASKPKDAKKMYNNFISCIRNYKIDNIKTGIFGSDMKVNSTNDGPYTLIIDTKNKE